MFDEEIENINLHLCENNTIWVNTDVDPIGGESFESPILFTKKERFIIALLKYFECDIDEISTKIKISKLEEKTE